MEAIAESARAPQTDTLRPADPQTPPDTGQDVLAAAAVAHGTTSHVTARRSAPPTRMLALQAMAGNRAVARMLQRDGDQGGGMSTPNATSAPGNAPTSSVPTGQQKAGRERIDDALKDFAQSKFRDITDWSLATDAEKFTLIDKATDLGLFWVGPRDEYALEACWQSFGGGFAAAVKKNRVLWNRSILRGVDPENLTQTKGSKARFKKDILAAADHNLDANEDRVVKEFGDFGLTPPSNLLSNRAMAKADKAAPSLNATPPIDRLKEQARLAKVVKEYDRKLERVMGLKVGIAIQPFNPGNKPPEGQDIDLGGGMTTWQLAYNQWLAVQTEMALILNAWPVLYSAHATGGIDIIANQTFDAPDPNNLMDPKAMGQRDGGLTVVREQMENVLRSIKKVRDSDPDPLDLVPVQRALYTGRLSPQSGIPVTEEVMVPILSDEKETRDFEAAMAKLAIDIVLAAAMIVGVVGTMGGAAVAIGVAGVAAAKADTKADSMSTMFGAAVSDDTALVTKEAVTAAQAEAQVARIELAMVALTSVVDIGMHGIGQHLNAIERQKVQQLLGKAAPPPVEAANPLDKLRQKLRANAESRPGAAAVDTSPKKPWGIAPDLRGTVLKDPVNVRLRADGVPELRGVVPNSQVRGARWNNKNWTVEVNPNLLAGDEISRNKFDELIETIYHEARHARQDWEVARWRKMKAARGEKFTEVFPFEIDPTVAAQAKPMQPGDAMEQLAEKWHESVYGGKALARNETYRNIEAAQAVLERQTQVVNNLPLSTPPTERALAENQLKLNRSAYDKWYLEYRALPEEIDAVALSGMQRNWARSGLDTRFAARVEAAQATLDSANVRVAESSQELAKYRSIQASSQAVEDASTSLRQAQADAARAQTDLAAAKASQ